MMRSRRQSMRSARRGFTLLELLLATVAAGMLMSALYIAMNITVDSTEQARNAAGTEDLMRGVFNRMAVDVNGTLGVLPWMSGGQTSNQNMYQSITNPPYMQTSSGSSSGSGSSGSGSGGMSSGSSGGSTTGGTSSSSSSSTTATGDTILGTAYVNPMIGVVGGYQGNTNMLILFTSKVPDVFTTTDANSLAQLYSNQSQSSGMQFPPDLRRVVYWLGSNGGLYRHETPWVTGIEGQWQLMDLPMADDAGVQIAKEVTNVIFEYWDPIEETWETSWDGTGSSSPPYSLTPGPPTAIRVTLTFQFENPKGGRPGQTTTYHTFPIFPAGSANPLMTQGLTLYDPTASSTSSSSSSSNSGSGSGSGGGSGGMSGNN